MSEVSSASQMMGKDQFLRLFTTQARMQNPMNPIETSDFLAQLAQFSSVEQMTNLNTNFEKMLSVQQTQQASQFLGKVVFYEDPSGASGEGYVSGVRLTSEGPVLLLGNSQVPIEWVTSMYQI